MEHNRTLISESKTFVASDGYPLHVTAWAPLSETRAHVVVLHGVQSHAGWYHSLGATLAGRGYHASFPDRRGSGANDRERGHAGSARRLVADLAEWLQFSRAANPETPTVLAGISWGGKLAVVAAAKYPELIDAVALICPGLHPRVGLSLGEKFAIARAYFTNRYKTFPIPLSDPALFTANPEGQAFIAADRFSLRQGTAGLLVSSVMIDRMVRRAQRRVLQPCLLMLAGEDRIVDNAKTLAYFDAMMATRKTLIEYPSGHHTLEFEPDPLQYALDLAGWLDGTFK